MRRILRAQLYAETTRDEKKKKIKGEMNLATALFQDFCANVIRGKAPPQQLHSTRSKPRTWIGHKVSDNDPFCTCTKHR